MTFSPTPIVSFETYSTLARSRPVLETVLTKLPEPLTIAELERLATLHPLLAPGRAASGDQVAPLVVTHRVMHNDPELAAQIANTWAEVSLETIRDSVLGTLEPVREITQRELSRLRAVLEEAEEALSTFERGTNVELLLKRFERLNVRVADFELRAGDLESALAVTRARVTMLQTQLDGELARLASIDPTTGAALAGLSLTEALAVVVEQVVFLEGAYAQARAALDQFDKANDLVLTAARIESLQGELVSGEQQLAQLEASIQAQDELRTLLVQQLAEEARAVTSADPFSDSFLAGLSLEQVRSLIGEQFALAQVRYEEARAALDQFDKANDLVLLDAQIGQLNARIPQLGTRLSSLPNEIERVQITLNSLQVQLKAQPPLLTLRDHITANPLLGELALQGGNVQEVLLETGLLRETLNPRHFSLLEMLLSAEVQLSELHEEGRLVQRELAELTALLETKQAQRVQLNSQRTHLVQRSTQADSDLVSARSRASLLEYAALDPREALRLRDTTPEVVELQRSLRESEQQIAALQSQRETLGARLAANEAEIVQLREALTEAQSQRTHLVQRSTQADSDLVSARSRASLLEYAALDPREALRLRDTTPEVVELQRSLRESEQQIAALQSQRETLGARLAANEAEIVQLREALTEAQSQRELLVFNRDRAITDFRALREQQDRLQLVALGAGNGERSLREATPEVLELRRLLREQGVILAAQQRELAELTDTLERDREALSVLQQELASSELRLEQLTRARNEALEAYQEVVSIDPTISFFTALSPVSARVLSEATVPVEPVGWGRLLSTVLAVLVTGAALLVFVFLREAIADPALADSKWRKARSSLT